MLKSLGEHGYKFHCPICQEILPKLDSIDVITTKKMEKMQGCPAQFCGFRSENLTSYWTACANKLEVGLLFHFSKTSYGSFAIFSGRYFCDVSGTTKKRPAFSLLVGA